MSVPLAHYLRFQPNRTGRAQPWYWWIRRDGPPGARRDAGAGRSLARAGIPGGGARRLDRRPHGHDAAPDEVMPGAADARRRPGRAGRERCAPAVRPAAAHPDGAGRPGAGRGLRQRRQPAAGPRHRAPPRGRAAPRARRQPGPHRPAAVRRIGGARRAPARRSASRWRGGAAACCWRCARSATPRSCSICRSTGACSASPSLVAVATALLFGLAPGAARHAGRSDARSSRAAPARSAAAAAAPGPGADGGADRAVAGPAGQHRPVRADAGQPPADRRRLQPRRPGAVQDRRGLRRLHARPHPGSAGPAPGVDRAAARRPRRDVSRTSRSSRACARTSASA